MNVGRQFIGIPLVISQQKVGANQTVLAHYPGEHSTNKESELSFDDRSIVGTPPQPGRIDTAWVPEEYRRQGIATAMLKYATLTAPSTGAIPAHSSARTDSAEAWAQSTKDLVSTPRRELDSSTGQKIDDK